MKLISNECVHPLFISEGKTTVEDNGADFFIFELVEAIWISNSTLCRKSRVQIIFHLFTQSNVNIIFALIHKEIFLLYVYYLFLFFAVYTYIIVQYNTGGSPHWFEILFKSYRRILFKRISKNLGFMEVKI